MTSSKNDVIFLSSLIIRSIFVKDIGSRRGWEGEDGCRPVDEGVNNDELDEEKCRRRREYQLQNWAEVDQRNETEFIRYVWHKFYHHYFNVRN